MTRPSEPVVFSNQGLRLAGSLRLPDGVGPWPVLLVLHAANGGARAFPFYRHLATHLPARGMAVFIYDRRGSGQSEGDRNTASFDDLAGDAAAAIDALSARADIDSARIGVYGISQGGWLAPMVAVRRPNVAFLAIVSGCGVPPARQMDYGASWALRAAGFSDEIVERAIALRHQVNDYYRGNRPREETWIAVERARAEPWFERAYLPEGGGLPENVVNLEWRQEMDFDPLPVWRQVGRPALFVFAGHDRWVPIEESIANFRAATAHLEDVTFARIAGTDHLMNGEENEPETNVSRLYLQTLLAWLNRFLRG